jgi:hypothetical protein
MAYDKNKMIKECLTLIEIYNLVFLEDIYPLSTFSRQTFYNQKLDKVDDIKKALDKNKIALKSGLRKRWWEKSNPITDLALYKLIGTSDERDALNNAKQKLDVTTNGEKITEIKITKVIIDKRDKNSENA